MSTALHCLCIKKFLLLKSGCIEPNPGSCKISSLKFFSWNLTGLAAHEFTKLSLIEGYIDVNGINIICLAQTFLNSSIPIDCNRLSIPSYSIMRVNHPSNTKRGRVCLSYQED